MIFSYFCRHKHKTHQIIKNMKRTLLILFAAIALTSCAHVNIDEVKKGIIETETKRLPMTIQKLEGVREVKIDSLVIVNNAEPYAGYLVTEWKMLKEYDDFDRMGETYEINPKVNVEVRNITIKGRQYSWEINWYGAYSDIRYDDTY